MDDRVTYDATDVEPLLEAVMTVGSEVELPLVLRRIVEAARSLADASYGALGVLSPDGQDLAQFLHVGVEPEQAKAIGDLPRGRGVLGELIKHPTTLRLDRLADSPASFGFPPGHPPMTTFLGVPVQVHGEVFGNLYLTDKRGGQLFQARDEFVVEALAAVAGVAIAKARRYSQVQDRERWQRATAEISTVLLAGEPPAQVLSLVARLTRELTGAAACLVAVPTDQDDLVVQGWDARPGGVTQLGLQLARSGELGRVLRNGTETQLDGPDLPALPAGGAGTRAAVPLGPRGAARGVLALLGLPVPLTEDTLGLLEGFAAHAAVALELADRRVDAESYAVHEDRDRIARDLHDLVIQRLFATGMGLESALRLIPARPQDTADRVSRAVDELDTTIAEIRSAIYDLQQPSKTAPSLRPMLAEDVDAAVGPLGFAPSLRLSGRLSTGVGPEVIEHLRASLREALSNVARHAHASAVEVVVTASDSGLELQVQDDGVGLAPGRSSSGLTNLQSRAEELGGQLTVWSVPGAGLRLIWTVPLV